MGWEGRIDGAHILLSGTEQVEHGGDEQLIGKMYDLFLWFWGFHKAGDVPVTGDEKITFMLRRQKQRFGLLWWPWAIGWVAIPIWLTLHILGYA